MVEDNSTEKPFPSYRKHTRRTGQDLAKRTHIIHNIAPKEALFLEKEKTARLEKENKYDSLTGLYNRRYLFQLLEHYEANPNRGKIGVLMMDLDDFKKTNDEYGHQTGDVTLKHWADLLNSNIRDLDLAFRYGGEEAVILLPGIEDEEMLIKRAEQIREAIQNSEFTTHDRSRKFNKTVSIGATIWDSSDTHDFALSEADKAMYKAKELGKNRVISANNLINE